MNVAKPRFSNSKAKSDGVHYTPSALAEFVAVKIAEAINISDPLVIDPACGDGELLKAMRHCIAGSNIVGFDLDAEALTAAQARVGAGRFEQRDFLELALQHRDGGLFAPLEKADIVIANPPYVRTQVMGADRSQEIASAFDLRGRVDLYHAFLEGISEVMKPGGIAGVIVSNRFMTTKAGALVRERILQNFDVIHVWDLGDTRLFEAAVLPAVLILRKKDGREGPNPKMTSIYSTAGVGIESAPTPIAALALTGNIQVGDSVFEVSHGLLDSSDETWRVGTDIGDEWLRTVHCNTHLTFGDIGKIRVGIKTTADKIFVRKEWEEPHPELLRPLLTHRSARRYRSLNPTHQILYTHFSNNGKKKVVDLNDYPISREYLESHREALEKRTYVISAGRKWFEIWVPQNPGAWSRPMLVWPDISEQPCFWISLDEELVQGDCYWIVANPESEDLLWLALAVANSKFIEHFYDRKCGNKLYAGRRRFMTQYVEKFPLPDPSSQLSKEIVAAVKKLYAMVPAADTSALEAEVSRMVSAAFGLPVEEVTG